MAKRIKQRTGKRGWRFVEIIGWIALAGGFIFFVVSLDASIRREVNTLDNLLKIGAGAITLCLGAVLVVSARDSDSEWICSRCKKQVRSREDKACLNCLVLFD